MYFLSHVLDPDEALQVAGQGHQGVVFFAAVEGAHWDYVAHVLQRPRVGVRHEDYVLKVPVLSQDFQIRNVLVKLIIVEALFL